MQPTNRQIDNKCGQMNQRRKSKKGDAVADIISSFNTWAFKREQPSDFDALGRAVQHHAQLRKPIEFVLYWGKGPRVGLAEPEIECLDYLATMGRRIRHAYAPGASFRVIFTDTHALLNGHARSDAMSYFAAVGAAAQQRDFGWCLLSDVLRDHAGNLVHKCPAERPARTIEQLERSAVRWYKGSGRPVDGAIAYFDMNMIEKRAVEMAFPHAIFATFSGSELRVLFPEGLPIFYMYSVRKGVSVKPWFIEGNPGGAVSAAII